MSLSCAMSRLYVPGCGDATVTLYWLPEPATEISGSASTPSVRFQLFRVPSSPL